MESVIFDYIQKKYPKLVPLYEDIYIHGNRIYWEKLDARLREYAQMNGLEYVRNEDDIRKPFELPPVIVNCFYHEEIKKSKR